MGDPEALKKLVAEFLETSPEKIHAGLPLRHPRLKGSAGKALLAAAIHRQLGVYSNRVLSAKTYGELEAAVFDRKESTSDPVVAPSHPGAAPATTSSEPVPGLASGLRVGVDVEMVQSMPEAPDFWAAEFYRSHFTPAEIAYCLRQDHPRVHFAARWCAKEALAKCDSRFVAVSPSTIQVAHRPDGQPILEVVNGNGGVTRLDVALSLSHTPLMAVAVVVAALRSE